MHDTLPTFRTNKDRLTFLLAEYKIPITFMVLAGSVWAAYFTPQLPRPPDSWLQFSFAWLLLSLPCFIIAKQVVKRLYSPDWVHVGIADPGEQLIYDGKKVPPDVWADKTVRHASPLEPDSGLFDYIVVKWNWMPDIEELEVQGCERADMDPAEVLENAARVDEYYEYMHLVRRAYSRQKATIQSVVSDVHDAVVMQLIGETEDSDLVPDVEVSELLEPLEEKSDEIPDAPEPESDLEQLDNSLGDLDLEEIPTNNGHEETEVAVE